MELFSQILQIAALVFGFGFVVFIHELGHFLAAKWTGVKVEQFAVGMGHAMISFRKGLGLTLGSTRKKYEQKVDEYIRKQESAGSVRKSLAAATIGGSEKSNSPDVEEKQEQDSISEAQRSQWRLDAEEALGIGETEYRISMLPIGGYVKMLGQDDTNPNVDPDDPRSFRKKSVGARMLILSAGVVMNVILAFLLFVVVFLIGFNVEPAMVGIVQPNSPAQMVGLRTGDRIKYMDGKYQHDFTKVQLNTALAPVDEAIPIVVERDGKMLDPLMLRPQNAGVHSRFMLSLGIGHMPVLEGLPAKLAGKVKKGDGKEFDLTRELVPGDVIVKVNGRSVDSQSVADYVYFDKQLQDSALKPVVLEVRGLDGKTREVRPEFDFATFFGDTTLSIGGLRPRVKIIALPPKTLVKDKLQEGDVIVALKLGNDLVSNPSTTDFMRHIGDAGDKDRKVDFVVQRKGVAVEVAGVVPTFRTGRGKPGIGVVPAYDTDNTIIASIPTDSAASRIKDGLRSGSKITHVNGQAVKNWFELHTAIRDSKVASPMLTVVQVDSQTFEPVGAPQEVALPLSDNDRAAVAAVRYAPELAMNNRIEVRETNSPIEAAKWGVTETRDMLLHFYVTLHRLAVGSVPASNLMGPVGIFHAGSHFAFKGTDWLIWFLAMISANLAVVNFLPIPILDGGHVLFLIIEKITGKPPSPRVQHVAFIFGITLILSLVVFVTYHDIARLIVG